MVDWAQNTKLLTLNCISERMMLFTDKIHELCRAILRKNLCTLSVLRDLVLHVKTTKLYSWMFLSHKLCTKVTGELEACTNA